MNPSNEAALVRRAQRGDREAFGLLFEDLAPKLLGYLVNTLKDKVLAEDILQTSWIKAIEGLPQTGSVRMKFTPWLFTIARNECREHWRRSGRETPFDAEKHDIADHSRANLDDRALVEKVLQDLSEDDREILRLRYIADMPFKDIAAVLDLGSVTARVRTHRALGRARQILKSNLT